MNPRADSDGMPAKTAEPEPRRPTSTVRVGADPRVRPVRGDAVALGPGGHGGPPLPTAPDDASEAAFTFHVGIHTMPAEQNDIGTRRPRPSPAPSAPTVARGRREGEEAP